MWGLNPVPGSGGGAAGCYPTSRRSRGNAATSDGGQNGTPERPRFR